MKDLEELQAKHHQVLQEKVQLESQVTGSGRSQRASRTRRRGNSLHLRGLSRAAEGVCC